ncbi:hypothetical protein LPJ59_000848 [Coemansia sp. RSA 2399]|nr:hypothetical protein LPJ59_000848 [Coemansia sp. RSA 2399]KAJ1907475.1 hypothetical protein LPJ81_000728 [Coemansia sp. IMI 209127]
MHVATPKLQQFLDESRDGQHRDVSVLRVQVRGDNLVETARKNGPANGDLSQIEEFLGDIPAFVLLRATPSTWYVITWMPEGKVGVHSSMVYASTQSNLKAAVGDCVEDLLQFGSVDDVFGNEPAAQPSASTAVPEGPAASKAVAPPAPAPKPAGLELKRPPSISTSNTDTEKQSSEQAGSYVVESTRVILSTRTATTTTTTTTTTASDDNTAASSPDTFISTAAPVGVGAYAAQTRPSAQRGGVFVKKMDPRLAMSKSELEHMNVLSEEDSARSEQLEQMRLRLCSRGASPVQPPVAPNSNNQHANTAGQKQTVAATSGGFHTVTLPLSPQAEAALSEFLSNVGITVVELQVEANKCVTSMRSFTSMEEFVPNPSEPRFYIMRTPGSRAFVYSCPESSQPRMRMAYSTTGASTLAQIQGLGCRITHRLSLFTPKECTLIAVAATIRNGQAQRVDSEKPVDDVVNYVPNAPARSLPSRFAVNTTKILDGFTDEQGFRKAFSNVRSDSPAPVPFKDSAKPEHPLFIHAAATSDNSNVDNSPNTGATAWGVQLKSSNRKGMISSPAISYTASNNNNNSATDSDSATRKVSAVRSSLPAPAKPPPATKPVIATAGLAAASVVVARMQESETDAKSIKKSFSQVKLAGEAGDTTPSDLSTPSITPAPLSQLNEAKHSSLPGLKNISSMRGNDEISDEYKWDPWRSVSTTSSTAAKKPDVPHSSLQSTVYTKDKDGAPESIMSYMSDITYPPLQQGTTSHES